jgi:hypothetical protein
MRLVHGGTARSTKQKAAGSSSDFSDLLRFERTHSMVPKASVAISDLAEQRVVFLLLSYILLLSCALLM